MNIIKVGNVQIPIENIDYIREGEYYSGDYIMLKSGKRINCTREHFRQVEAELERDTPAPKTKEGK